jgi:hypothetical protein
MKIRRYNPNTALKSQNVFYIQSHGLNAGRPLKNPIPNSWEVQTETANAFEICFVIFNSKILELYIRGSVIPFIALHEYKKIIQPYLNNPSHCETIIKKLDTVQKIDLALEELEQKKKLYKQLKTALSKDILKNIQKPLN